MPREGMVVPRGSSSGVGRDRAARGAWPRAVGPSGQATVETMTLDACAVAIVASAADRNSA